MRRLTAVCLFSTVSLFRAASAEETKVADVLESAQRLAEEREKLEAELIAILKEESTDKKLLERQGKAVELLGRIGTARAVPALVAVVRKYFEPTPPGVRRTGGVVVAEQSEGWGPPTRGMHALAALGPLTLEALMETYANEPHPCKRIDKQQALRMLPCRELAVALARKKLEEERNKEIRGRLLSLLVSLGDSDWVERFHPAWVAALRGKGWKSRPEAPARRQPQAEQPGRPGKAGSPLLVVRILGTAAIVALLMAWAFLRHRRSRKASEGNH